VALLSSSHSSSFSYPDSVSDEKFASLSVYTILLAEESAEDEDVFVDRFLTSRWSSRILGSLSDVCASLVEKSSDG
jgi:hypothetical protein